MQVFFDDFPHALHSDMPDPALFYRGPYIAQAFPPPWTAPQAVAPPGPYPQPYQNSAPLPTPAKPSGPEPYPSFAGGNPWPDTPQRPPGSEAFTPSHDDQTPPPHGGPPGVWIQNPGPQTTADFPGRIPDSLRFPPYDPEFTSTGGEHGVHANQNPLFSEKGSPEPLKHDTSDPIKAARNHLGGVGLDEMPPMAFSSADLPHQGWQPPVDRYDLFFLPTPPSHTIGLLTWHMLRPW